MQFDQTLENSRNKTLIVVASPLQTICALEAINYFDIEDYEIIILYGKNHKIINTGSKKILDEKNISYKELQINSLFGLLLFLVKTNMNKYHRIIVGEYYSAAQRLISVYWGKSGSDIIYVDDGNATLSIFQHRFPLFYPLNIRNYIRLILPGVFLMVKNFNYKFFTMYDLKESSNHIRIYKNELKALKYNISEENVSGIYIIGTNTNLANTMLVKWRMTDYLRILVNNLQGQFPNEILYFSPHRIDIDNLEIKSICEDLKVCILTTEISVEIDYLSKGYNPKVIIGFGSSALFTLKHIFPNASISSVYMTFKSNFDNICYRKIEQKYIEEGIKIVYIENKI